MVRWRVDFLKLYKWVVVSTSAVGQPLLFLILLAAASNHRDNQQQNNRSDDRCYQRAKRAYGNPSHQPHEPATEKTADDADYQVDDKARSAAPDNKVRQPAGNKSNKKIPQEIHNFSVLFCPKGAKCVQSLFSGVLICYFTGQKRYFIYIGRAVKKIFFTFS